MCHNNRIHGQKLFGHKFFEPSFKKFAWQFKIETSAAYLTP